MSDVKIYSARGQFDHGLNLMTTRKVVLARDYAALEGECERLRQFEVAYNDWQAKTDWVQESAKPHELGRHRADVLRARIEALAAEVERLREHLEVAKSDELNAAVWAETEAIRHELWDAQRELAHQAERQGEVQGRWIPVSERLPSVAQEVIVNSEFDGVTAGFLDSYGEWYAPNSDYKLTRVVAWQPLPTAPAPKERKMSEVERYWPEEIVGTGELVVYAQDYAALEAERDTLRKQRDKLAQALENIDREHELLRRMKNCEIHRPRGSFGVAVMSDPIAIEWQALDSELQQLIDARRDQGFNKSSEVQRLRLVEMIDAAMVEMQNISPPLRRSECERLIRAALSASTGQEVNPTVEACAGIGKCQDQGCPAHYAAEPAGEQSKS